MNDRPHRQRYRHGTREIVLGVLAAAGSAVWFSSGVLRYIARGSGGSGYSSDSTAPYSAGPLDLDGTGLEFWILPALFFLLGLAAVIIGVVQAMRIPELPEGTR